MQIVQVSDLHIGGLFKQNAFDDIVNEINNELKPDAIIISGDLVDEGIIYQYRKGTKGNPKIRLSKYHHIARKS